MRRPEILWTTDGESDLRHFYAAMEEGAEGSGDRFVLVLDSALELLRSFPEMAPMYEPPFRRLLVGKRDIGIFYVVEGRRLVIHALTFLHRDPTQLQNRLGLSS